MIELILSGISEYEYWRESRRNPKLEGSSRTDLSKTAAKMFSIASAECPASVPAQSAIIAAEHRTLTAGYPLDLLRLALLSDRRRINQLIRAAVIKHKARPTTAPLQIEFGMMFAFVDEDFRLAKRMAVLNITELKDISGIQYREFGIRGVERHYKLVEDLIDSRTDIFKSKSFQNQTFK